MNYINLNDTYMPSSPMKAELVTPLTLISATWLIFIDDYKVVNLVVGLVLNLLWLATIQPKVEVEKN